MDANRAVYGFFLTFAASDLADSLAAISASETVSDLTSGRVQMNLTPTGLWLIALVDATKAARTVSDKNFIIYFDLL